MRAVLARRIAAAAAVLALVCAVGLITGWSDANAPANAPSAKSPASGQLTSPGAAEAAPPNEPASDTPLPPTPTARVLDAPLGGKAAIAALGPKISDVAATNDTTVDELTSRLKSDSTLHVDPQGRLFYVEEAFAQPDPPAGTALATSAALSQSDTFSLHSNPGAPRTIYLDFVGANISGTAWNSSYSLPAGNYPAYDTDGNPASFSTTELAAIHTMWGIVAEDYAPFNVDVTTADPGDAALARSSSADQVYGARAVITSGTSASSYLCNNQCAGVSYVGTFDLSANAQGQYGNSYYQPSFVFSSLSSTVEYTSETISHELGHQLGLYHEGTPTQPYYFGANGWSAIMGSARFPISQWGNLSYPGATLWPGSSASPGATQDDLSVITSNGLAFRADDYGDTVSTAAPYGTTDGVISNRNDVDVINLGTCTGALGVSATSPTTRPNLDIDLSVLGPAGQTLGHDNPPSVSTQGSSSPSGMDAAVSINASGGPYYARIDGSGRGTWANGYDDYDSLGQYHLTTSCLSSQPQSSTPFGHVRVSAVSSSGPGQAWLFWFLDSTTDASTITSWTLTESQSGTRTVLPAGTRAARVVGLAVNTSSTISVRADLVGGTSVVLANVTVVPRG